MMLIVIKSIKNFLNYNVIENYLIEKLFFTQLYYTKYVLIITIKI